MKTITEAYKDLMILKRKEDKLGLHYNTQTATKKQSDDFWDAKANVTAFLRNFIYNHDFTELPKEKLLTICCMVSSYRPIDPWKFLVQLSINNERKQKHGKEKTR